MLQKNKQNGFHIIEVVIGVVVVAGIASLIAWRVHTTQQQTNANKQAEQLTQQEVALSNQKDEATQQPANPAPITDIPQTSNATTNGSVAQQTPSVAPQPTPPAPINNTTPGTAAQPTSNITRPTAEFCTQKDGNSFTNVWLTDNQQYSYQIWENGGFVTKTETGTPVRNYDTMNIIDVLPYLTKPSWAICSDRAGYVMVYYTIPGSPYTFNSLVAFGHISLTQP